MTSINGGSFLETTSPKLLISPIIDIWGFTIILLVLLWKTIKSWIKKSAASTLELPEYRAILAFIAEPVKKKLEKTEKVWKSSFESWEKIGKIEGIQNTETFVELQKTDKDPVYLIK